MLGALTDCGGNEGVRCEEKARLAMEYEAATAAFSEAVKEMNRRIGTSLKEEYQQLERNSAAARVKVRAGKIDPRATHRRP
jgi:hypothetical protein